MSSTIPLELNNTFITLILKVKKPEHISQYRTSAFVTTKIRRRTTTYPVLCLNPYNTIYKTINKIIVNRIRPLLKNLISPTQCSFLLRRWVVDNAIIVKESIHSFQRMLGRMGNMMLKLDLEKAFDILEWSFIRKSLHNLGFPTPFVNLIMNCISSPSFSFMRGIRQEDPLSPYIFIICMQFLNHLIKHAILNGDWNPVKLNRSGPPISHLLFADGLILFSRVDI